MSSFNMFNLEHVAVFALAVLSSVSISLSKITLNVPEYAMQGDTATLECRISKSSSSIDSATVTRNTGTLSAPNVHTLATRAGRHPDAPSNIAVKVTVLPDGTCRLIVTVSNIQRDDAAFYICSAGRMLPTGYMSLGSRSSYLAVLYYPTTQYPSCSTSPPSTSLQKEVGDVLRIDCTTELGNPHVNLVWGRTGDGLLPDPIEFVTSTTLRSELSVTLSATDNGAHFVCISKSAAFPDYLESCVVGPITLPVHLAEVPSTQSTNISSVTTELQKTEINNSCNSSFSGFTLDLKSPIVIGGIAAVGALVLTILVTILVCCIIKCCTLCCKQKKAETDKDDCELKEISPVITNNTSTSKDKASEADTKPQSSTPPEYTTSEAKTQDTRGKTQDTREKTQETRVPVLEEKVVKPKATSSSVRKSKDYPPPPSYPRPEKGLSLKSNNRNSARYSQNMPEVIVYGNFNSVTTNGTTCPVEVPSKLFNSKETESVAYGNVCSAIKRSPHSTPSPTKRLEEPFQTQKVNGSPLQGKKELDGGAYGNLNSLYRKNTRSSPTLSRPNKAPPPPPVEQNDCQSALKSGDIGKVTNNHTTASVPNVTNGINT